MKKEPLGLIDKVMVGLFAAIMLVVLVLLLAPSHTSEKPLGIIVLLLSGALSGVSYVKYKSFFTGNQTDLFVPKIYGMGLSVNPNHPLGKWMWRAIFVLLFAITLKLIFT